MPRATREESDAIDHVARLYRSIYAVVRKIPEGRVATYGQVAELAGIPGGARVAGAALKTSKPSDRLPWQRVIGKAGKTRGRIAIYDPVGAAIQRQLLEAEGVPIGDSGLIKLDLYGWLPSDSQPRKRRERQPQAGRVPNKPQRRKGAESSLTNASRSKAKRRI